MSRRYVAEIVMTSFVWATAAATTKDPAVVRSVWVVRGGRAELPCTPTPKHKQDSAVLVLWYRSSDTVPVYSYDARESEFTSGVPWADEGALGGRAHYMPESEPPTLVLEPAHALDQGMYTCRVDYRLSPSTTVIFNLTVVIPPGPPMILWGGRGIVAVVGPLGEGERAELTCRSEGGRPPPTLTWTRRGRQLPLLRNNSVTDANTGTTRVSAVVSIVGRREHLGSTLSCHARTPPTTPADLVPSQTASVVVNVTLAPVEVRILGSGTAVTAGTDLRLVCRAAGSHPPALLVWWRGHIRLPNVTHDVADGGNVSTATLTLRVDRSYNGVTLACSASNPALPHAKRLMDTIKLNVFYPPVVRLSLGRPLDPDSIKEGDDVYFECSIVSNPAFHRVDWRHNGVVVAPNVSSGVVVSGMSLVLRHLRRHHSGSYTCGASNLEGYNISNVVSLSVRHTPVCAGARRERTQGVTRGSTAAVKCTVEAEPSHDITWTWTRKQADGSEEEVPEEDVRSDGLASSVLVTTRAPEDYGRFMCLAKNAVGRQKVACVVTLVPAGPPDTPTNCSVAPADPTVHGHGNTAALSITCLEGFDGDLPQHFTLETWQDGNLVSNLTSLFPEWVVTGLRAGVGVTLRVAAHNARGRSDVIRFEVHTAIPQQRLAPDSDWGLLGVPPLLGALVGVGGVLLIVLVTGVIIVKYTRRTQPPTHVHTLVMTPSARSDSDTYDPDVVSSLRRHTDNLDVLPSNDYAHKPSSGKSHAHRQAVMRSQAQGQTVTRAYVNRQGNKHASITRGFCLHRQDSPLPDSDSDDSDDSDSDSTFTDLTAAGRAAAAVPPARKCTNSLPRAARREFRHVASSSLDLQLRACQRSQVVAASNGIIQSVPCLARDARPALPASSDELRRLTSSAEELHPLIFSRDLRQLLSSGDLRHVSFSGTELRMVPATGTWPPLSSSSGELRLPLPSSGTLHSLTTEELRFLPSSSPSSPWGVQAIPSLTQLPPLHQQMPPLPPCTDTQPLLPSLEIQQPQAPPLEAQQRSSDADVQSRASRVQLLQPGPTTRGEVQQQPPPSASEIHSRPSRREPPHPRVSGAASQPLPYCVEFHQLPPASGPTPPQSTHSQLQPRPPFSEPHSQPSCSELHSQQSRAELQPGPSCLKWPSLPSMEESQPAVSLRDLQPPPASGDLQPLLPLMKLQPPPSFRETHVAAPSAERCSLIPTEATQTSNLSPKTSFGEKKHTCSSVNCNAPSSNEAMTSFIVADNGQSIKSSSEDGKSSSSIATNQRTSASSGSVQNALKSPGEKHDSSTANYRSPISSKENKPGPAGRAPASIPRTLPQQTVRPSVNSSHSFTGKQAQPTPVARRGPRGTGKQVSFSDDETLEPPVVVRVPAKSDAGKSEKRCAQLFSNIDLSSPIVSKPPPPEAASGTATSGSPRKITPEVGSPQHTTGSPCSQRSTATPRLPSGTPERRNVLREVSSPVKPPRGTSRSSPLTCEDTPMFPKPVELLPNSRVSLDPAGLLEGTQELLKPMAAHEKPRASLKQAALLQHQESHKPVGTLEKPRVPVKPVSFLVHDKHHVSRERESQGREDVQSSPGHQQSSV